MATVVIGGHSRNLGKTSVVAGLIAALREYQWTAVKITQFGHGICSVNGESCDCATDEHTQAISEEKSRAGDSDTSRFLVAGAARSLWVRTKQGWLAEAMPDVRARLGAAKNVIIESNSVMRFVRPDLYIPVLDFNTTDFKGSAREFLDRADAVILHEAKSADAIPAWKDVSLKLLQGKKVFPITPPGYVTSDLVDFVRGRLPH
jgi:molybdopterin-guanine dinucleotide biosynthesis protein